MKKNNIRLLKDRIASRVYLVISIFGCCVLVFIGLGLLIKSIPVISHQGLFTALFSTEWFPLKGKFGLLTFIISTVVVTILSLIISVPICLLTAIYLSEYAKKRILNFYYSVLDILAGLPSVIYGVLGVIVIVPVIRDCIAPAFGFKSTGYSILAGGVVLGFMLIPNLILVFLEVLKNVPLELRQAALSLGATKWESIKLVVIRKSTPGIMASIILAMSRAFGETLAVLMVVGNVVKIPKSIFDPGYPLPSLIANNYGEMLSIPLYDSALMFAAFILFFIVIGFNILSKLFLKRILFNMKY
jgi:phosphate transport system permease protein